MFPPKSRHLPATNPLHYSYAERQSWNSGQSLSFLATGEHFPAKIPPYLHERLPWLFPSLSAARWCIRRKEVYVRGTLARTDTVVDRNDDIVVYRRGMGPLRVQNTRGGIVSMCWLMDRDDYVVVYRRGMGPLRVQNTRGGIVSMCWLMDRDGYVVVYRRGMGPLRVQNTRDECRYELINTVVTKHDDALP